MQPEERSLATVPLGLGVDPNSPPLAVRHRVHASHAAARLRTASDANSVRCLRHRDRGSHQRARAGAGGMKRIAIPLTVLGVLGVIVLSFIPSSPDARAVAGSASATTYSAGGSGSKA